jgi:hypothetical protein
MNLLTDKKKKTGRLRENRGQKKLRKKNREETEPERERERKQDKQRRRERQNVKRRNRENRKRKKDELRPATAVSCNVASKPGKSSSFPRSILIHLGLFTLNFN